MAIVSSVKISSFPAYKVIGLAFKASMMDKDIPAQWDRFFKENKHRVLEQCRQMYPIQEPLDYVGLMFGYDPVEETMIYLIGAIMDEKTPDQAGYTSYVLPQGLAITTIIEGKGEVYSSAHELTMKAIDGTRYTVADPFWSMELYTERFMKAMAKQDGSLVLDYRIPLSER